MRLLSKQPLPAIISFELNPSLSFSTTETPFLYSCEKNEKIEISDILFIIMTQYNIDFRIVFRKVVFFWSCYINIALSILEFLSNVSILTL